MGERHSEPGIHKPEQVGDVALPALASLEDFASESENEGVQIDSLAPGTEVRVKTRNSEYRLTVLEGGRRRVLVQGGILPTASEARVEGATAGGSVLHSGWIERNRSLELACGPRRIITSRVRDIQIETPSTPSEHRAA
jgi:hypothetical protein